MKIDTALKLTDYLWAIQDMASAYFDDDTSEYQPQYGTLNAMRVFYNLCVTKSDYDERLPHNISDYALMSEIIQDKAFLAEYDRSIKITDDIYTYDFAHAYVEAQKIVQQRAQQSGYNIGGIISAVVRLASSLETFVADTKPLLSKVDAGTITDIFQKIIQSDITPDTVAEAFGKSERFKEIISTPHDEEGSQ